jgi:hypothetical protein
MLTVRAMNFRTSLVFAGVAAALTGCAPADDGVGSDEADFTSAEARLLDFEFDGELLAAGNVNLATKVRGQLLYAVGQLNGLDSGPRLNAVKLSNLSATPAGGGLYRVRYHAKLPVAWNKKNAQPAQFTLVLPRRVDVPGLATFLTKYGPTCTEHGGHDLTSGNVWYYFRPNQAGCTIAPKDAVTSVATVTVSPLNTVNKYPEYHRVWEDGALDVVAVFGKYEKGATSNYDAGIWAWNDFIGTMRAMLPDAVTTPAVLPDAPGAALTDITFDADTPAGHVSVVALLSDEIQSAPPSFDARFRELTPHADMVLYGGHAGLGANVRSLTKRAAWFPGKYQLLFLDGCDTFSYEDDALNASRVLLNPSDASGTKYLDVMRNAMPAYFNSLSGAVATIIDSLLDRGTPRTYEQIFAQIDAAQVVLVTGEEDNVYTPGLDLGARWAGLRKAGNVGYKQAEMFASEPLEAGRYVFELTPEPSAPGGDADLFVRVGSAPTATSTYKCPSYKANSNERCVVTATQPAVVHMRVVGDKSTQRSAYRLRAWQELP